MARTKTPPKLALTDQERNEIAWLAKLHRQAADALDKLLAGKGAAAREYVTLNRTGCKPAIRLMRRLDVGDG